MNLTENGAEKIPQVLSKFSCTVFPHLHDKRMGVVLWKKTAVVLYPSFYLCNYLFCSREQPGTPTKYNGEVVNWVRNI